MKASLNILDNVQSACGTCNSGGCNSCGPVPSLPQAPTLLTRRDLGRTILGASAAALLVGCSRQPTTEQAKPPTGAMPLPFISPELSVVVQSKGPIMTVLEEFYKIGPGLPVPTPWAP